MTYMERSGIHLELVGKGLDSLLREELHKGRKEEGEEERCE